jgi:hypothetical protein
MIGSQFSTKNKSHLIRFSAKDIEQDVSLWLWLYQLEHHTLPNEATVIEVCKGMFHREYEASKKASFLSSYMFNSESMESSEAEIANVDLALSTELNGHFPIPFDDIVASAIVKSEFKWHPELNEMFPPDSFISPEFLAKYAETDWDELLVDDGLISTR